MTEVASPNSIEAEQSVLGSMLIHPQGLAVGLELLNGADFYRPVHQEIFDCLNAASGRSEPVDIVTLTEELKKRDKLDECGGVEYILTLCDSVPTYQNVQYYAGIVKDKSIRREIAASLRLVMKRALDESTEDPLAYYVQSAMECARNHVQAKWTSSDTAAHKIMDALIQPRGNSIPYGMSRLDHIIGGISTNTAELTIIGARSSNGKTALLNAVAMNCVKAGYTCAYFSYETDADKLCSFMASNIGCVDVWKLEHNGYSPREEEEAMSDYVNALGVVYNMRSQLRIWDSEDTPLPQLCILAENMVRSCENTDYPVGCILVDYAQIVDPGVNCRDLRSSNVAVIRGLKSLTRRLKVPVVVASQVTTAHKDMDAPPRKENLAEAPGALIAVADKILMIHNPPPRKGVTPAPRTTIFLVEKNKRGLTGSVPALFLGSVQRFVEVEEREEDD